MAMVEMSDGMNAVLCEVVLCEVVLCEVVL